ncbi:hypothetical protein [Nocardioides sp.]|uniref:hypothetical protein n=1 Tax=Nocardioides sp. TaxID=35761 RepID=UPI002C28EED9|nr:hypothetical protein [Nocardioides sp.]HXH77434.1 hypothetical protein [Nocardioides sp.]
MRALPILLLLALLTACGQPSVTAQESPTATPSEPSSTSTSGEEGGPGGIEPPPPFRVWHDGRELVLHPHTYCYGGGCVDGVNLDPPDVGSPEEIQVHVPVQEFALSVYAQELTREPRPDDPSFNATCGGRSFEVPVEDLGDGWYALRPAGPTALYDIQLFAQGGGDMIASLHWRTPFDGPAPEPSARLALIAEHDGEPDSYGLELAIDDLAQTPERVTAEITVTAGNGRSMTFAAEQTRDPCRSAGDLYFSRPDEPAKAAAALGDFPFTTTVTLTLDGRIHEATAVYPDDEIEGNEPSVALEFTPQLPGL